MSWFSWPWAPRLSEPDSQMSNPGPELKGQWNPVEVLMAENLEGKPGARVPFKPLLCSLPGSHRVEGKDAPVGGTEGTVTLSLTISVPLSSRSIGRINEDVPLNKLSLQRDSQVKKEGSSLTSSV